MKNYYDLDDVAGLLASEKIYMEKTQSGRYQYDYTGIYGKFSCLLDMDADKGIISLVTVLSQSVGKSDKYELLKFINQCNFQMFRGCWSYDEISGTVLLRTDDHVSYGEDLCEEVKSLLTYSCITADDFIPSFAVLENQGTAEDAVRELEKTISEYDVNI